MTDSPADTGRSDRWWVPIALLAATFPVTLALSVVLPPDPFAMLPVFAVVALGFLLALCSPAFLYFDKQYLAATGAWTPSVLYFLMAVPLVAPLVAAAYVYRRHEQVGVPANPLAD
ncbi:hypothetical protein [Halobacterium noricense]|uniref:hypothetical protein n=1 Tax=Halobacterium noricense TaxID=223182 RepID=UPI001E3ED856|nr:hypothetical protein [Halobacterium noricense]UHH24861.1 hypothetical protein LT974_12840 [Halobacterium noricense]